jgi:segregation and condensation protein B
MEDLKRIIEALLFASPEPLGIARMKAILQGVEAGELAEAIEALRAEYAGDSRSFQLVEIGGGYQLATKPEFADFVARLAESRRRQRLSKAAMETLAVIAYKQPVVRSVVEGIRGVNVDGVLRTLMEHDLIRIVGRADGPGRPLLFGTTREFLMQFGLNRLSDLPGLKEIEDLVSAKEAAQEEDREGKPDEGADEAPVAETTRGEGEETEGPGPLHEDAQAAVEAGDITDDGEEGKTQ